MPNPSSIMPTTSHRALAELEVALDHIRQSPRERGVVELIVRRPAENEREVLAVGELDVRGGLVGDTWGQRPSRRSDDGAAHPDMQINLMNVRVIGLVAGDRERWSLAGDQLYV